MSAPGPAETASLPLSGCSFGWLHQAPLTEALRQLAEHGFRTFELTTAPPHLLSTRVGPYERHELLRTLRSLHLVPVSLNPSFVDLNLISTNPEIRDLSEAQISANLELAADLGARYVVIIPGRRHALAPAPDDATASVRDDALHRLVQRGAALGITIALENSPYGYLGPASELLEIVDRFDSPYLGIAYDVANALAIEDPAQAVQQLGQRLVIAHVSDTWKQRWAHTSIGRGEVDFTAFAAALTHLGFTGPTVYELVDGEPPGPRLDADIAALAAAGWSIGTLPTSRP